MPNIIKKPLLKMERLSHQLAVLLSFLLVAAIMSFGGYIANKQYKLASASARLHALTLAKSIAAGSESNLLTGNLASIEELLLQAAAFPGVLRIRIGGPHNRVLSHVVAEAGNEPRANFNLSILSPPTALTTQVMTREGYLEIWHPVVSGELVGWINVHYSLGGVTEATTQILQNTVIALLLAILISTTVLLVYLRRPLRAIGRATEFATNLNLRPGELLALERGSAEIEQLQQALNEASTQLARQQRAVDESNERLQAVFTYAANGIITIDTTGRIESFNPAAESIFHCTATEVLGRNVKILMPEPDHSRHDGYLRNYLETGKGGVIGNRRELTGRRKDGAMFPMELAVSEMWVGDRRLFTGIVQDITERKQAEKALQESQRQYAELIDQSPDAIVMLDTSGTIQSVNPAAERISGYDAKELTGQHFADVGILTGRSLPTAQEEFGLVLAGNERSPFELEFSHKTGDSIVMEANPRLIRRQERPIEILVMLRDITERKKAEKLSSRLWRILDNSLNEIYVFEASSLQFIQVNQGARENLGYSMEELRDKTPVDLKPEFDRQSFETVIEPLRSGKQEMINFVTSHQRKDGSLYPVEVRLQLSRHETPPVFVAIIQDITERKQAEERLNYLAYYDSLTSLPNRVLLHERLGLAMREADRRDRLVAVMFLDLDRFKIINDSLGHDIGDALLKSVADRLQTSVRPGDTVARMSGDEFTVVLANVAHIDDVTSVAQKILDRFKPPFHVGGRELFVSTSIGITIYPFDDPQVENLLKNADAAMYHAKEHGRNTFQFYTAELNTRAERRLTLETALRKALEKNELLLHYQPQVDLNTGQITGMEALLRWHHPKFGMISPAEFIPLAEDTGLIIPIGEWVLRTACAQTRNWQEAGLPALKVAVNLSGKQILQKNLPALVEQVLNETGLAAVHLDLELTESMLMEDLEDIITVMRKLDAQGVGFSLDDFGTGYSSLSYLKRFPITTLKIDQAFVRDVTSNVDDAAIAKAIIAMAHGLGIHVIAEGVETREQLDFLLAHACDGLQGYYFSKPVPDTEFAELLRSGHRLELEQESTQQKKLQV